MHLAGKASFFIMKKLHVWAVVALFPLLLISCNNLEQDDRNKDDGDNPFTRISLSTKQQKG